MSDLRPPGPMWQAAIDFGIDVTLLEANLRMTPDERIQQLMAMQRLFDSVSPPGREPQHPNERMPGDEASPERERSYVDPSMVGERSESPRLATWRPREAIK